MTRGGFTLTELVIGMVVMAILGTALARVLMDNSRFVTQQDAMMESRATARAAMQAIGAELHMVPDSGLLMATRDSVTVRVPYAFGMVCGTGGGVTTGLLMPMDSLMYASAAPDSVGIRSPSGGTFTRRRVTSVTGSPNPASCTADSIRVIPGGRLIGMTIPGAAPASGSLFYLSQPVTYRFMTSVDVPGRRGLWRRAGTTGAYEELAAPFDTAAKFVFLMGPYMQVDSRTDLTTSASRDSVRGLELRLTGQSISTPQGTSGPQTFDLRTRIGFMNKTYVANQLVY
jgi:prepilin-type N-terminal cleavage/methylation domain-containing protein